MAALLIDATRAAAVGEPQQLVEQVEQLIAALDHQGVQRDQHQRMAARGLKAPQLLVSHSPPERLQRATTCRRQDGHVDLKRPELDEPAVPGGLAQQLLHAGSCRPRTQVRHVTRRSGSSGEERVELAASPVSQLAGKQLIDMSVRIRSCGRDHSGECVDRRAQHAASAKTLGHQPDQRRRSVLFDGALDEPFGEAVAIGVVAAPPVEVSEHELQVIATGLRASTIGQQLVRTGVDLAAMNTSASSGIDAISSGTNPRNRSAQSDTTRPRRFPGPR